MTDRDDPPADVVLADTHRRAWAEVLTSVVRVTRDLDAAEDATQEAFTAALDAWRRDGVPDTPVAWLKTVARRKALDGLRREETLARKLPLLIVPDEKGSRASSAIDDGRALAEQAIRRSAHRTPAHTPCTRPSRPSIQKRRPMSRRTGPRSSPSTMSC